MTRRTISLASAVGAWLALAAGASQAAPARRLLIPPADEAALRAAISEVEAGRRPTPLVGPAVGGEVTVTFLARRSGRVAPRIVSDVTGWGEHVDGTFDFGVGRMRPVGRTGWYVLRTKVAVRARIEYLVAYGPGDRRLDPHNPRRVPGEPPASEFVTDGYLAPDAGAPGESVPHGRLVDAEVPSRALAGTRAVTVYLPPGHAPAGSHGLAVFLDPRAGKVAPILDRLIARHAIVPVVAVFVAPHLPGAELSAAAPLRTFLSEELPAWLGAAHGVTTDVERRAVLAVSFGAKDALDVALSARAFGSVGLLIPGRRVTAADIRAIAAQTRPPLRVAILAGRYDLANVPTARALRDALARAGHVVDYVEVAEGHSPRTWLNHVGEVLTRLFEATSSRD
jgi:enterochelin esterase-like enzyme